MPEVKAHNLLEKGSDVPFESRIFSLVRIHEGSAKQREPILNNATPDQVYAYVRRSCGPSKHLASPEDILPTVPLYVPHSEGWRSGTGEVRISANPAIAVRRTL